MGSSILQKFKKTLVNLPGWRTDRKIVVIESDDWGMIRMASKEAHNWFLKHDYEVDQCPYNRNDTIESNKDLELLFEILNSVEDVNGNPAIMTANNIVANPDFEKIRDSNFSEYYYESFTRTLERYPGRDRVVDLYKEGIDHKLFFPQFHGREHINVNRWMEELRSGNKILHDAFKQNMFTVHKSGNMSCKRDHLDAFGMRYNKEWVSMQEIISSGLKLFKDIWGFRSLSFIAPCYIWSPSLEKYLYGEGIRYIQGTPVQRIPAGKNKIEKKYHYFGQQNKVGQRYLIRNVNFEPTEIGRRDSVAKALKEIKIAFRYNKPAIISSHRVNYMGSLRPENRDKNLKLLEELLDRIVKKYPNVEFMSSDQLGKLITGED